MGQAVNRQPLTTETRVRALVSLCGISDRQSGTWTGFPVNIIPPWLSTFIHRLEDEQ
jgi:hypothetical protein